MLYDKVSHVNILKFKKIKPPKWGCDSWILLLNNKKVENTVVMSVYTYKKYEKRIRYFCCYAGDNLVKNKTTILFDSLNEAKLYLIEHVNKNLDLQ